MYVGIVEKLQHVEFHMIFTPQKDGASKWYLLLLRTCRFCLYYQMYYIMYIMLLIWALVQTRSRLFTPPFSLQSFSLSEPLRKVPAYDLAVVLTSVMIWALSCNAYCVGWKNLYNTSMIHKMHMYLAYISCILRYSPYNTIWLIQTVVRLTDPYLDSNPAQYVMQIQILHDIFGGSSSSMISYEQHDFLRVFPVFCTPFHFPM